MNGGKRQSRGGLYLVAALALGCLAAHAAPMGYSSLTGSAGASNSSKNLQVFEGMDATSVYPEDLLSDSNSTTGGNLAADPMYMEGAVPEPTSMLLIGSSLFGLGLFLRKRVRK